MQSWLGRRAVHTSVTRISIGAGVNMGSVLTLATSGCKRSAPTRRQDSFSPSPGSPPPRDGLLGPQASRQVMHECGSRRSRRVGGPSPAAPLCWSRLFAPWYKCRPRPDRCRQFLRGRLPVLGALVLAWSIKGENIFSFLCVLGLFGVFFEDRCACCRGGIKELGQTRVVWIG